MKRSIRFLKASVPTAFAAGTMVGILLTSVAGAAFRGSSIFMDVPSTHYADEAIGEMYELGIIKGYDSTHFGPDDNLTRGQAALLFKRLRDELRGTVAVSFSKSSSSSKSSTSSSSSSSSAIVIPLCDNNALPYNVGGYVRFDANGYNVEKTVATGKATILIVRTGGNQGSGTVEYEFSAGSAAADKDFKAKGGTVTFANKQTNVKVELEIINNTSDIANRTVLLKLKNPTGAIKVGCPQTVILTIVDTRVASSSSSDGTTATPSAATMISLGASGYAIPENAGSITITVTRSGITTGANNVNYATSDGTAKAGIDYTATSGTLSFAANETTKTFSVSIANNANIEGARSFTVTLSSPTESAGLDISSASVAINDDESMTFGTGSFKFSSASYVVTEGSGKAVVTVQHVGGFEPVSVSYATSNGSALSGSDYTAVSGTLNFERGEFSKVFVIPIVKDSLPEGEETVNLTLSNPTKNATLVDPSSASIKIND